MSALLHGAIAALILFLTWSANRQMTDVTPIVQLVAGEGNNYLEREAAALGTSGGVKVDVPAPKAPERESPRPEPAPPAPAPEPVQMTAAPVQPAPAPTPVKKAPEKAAPKTPSLSNQIKRQVIIGESKAKQQVKKERDAEAKRQAIEAENAKKLTKAEFDAQNKTKAPVASKSAPTKVAKVDTEGIAKGVMGGSPKNISGGAGGTAMTADYANEMDAYFAYLKLQLRKLFEAPPGLNDLLKVDIEFRNHADGTITNARIAKSSGNREFDQAALDALRKVTLPSRPDKKTATHTVGFNLRDPE